MLRLVDIKSASARTGGGTLSIRLVMNREARSGLHGPDIGSHGLEAVGARLATCSQEHIFGGDQVHIF